MSPNIGEQRNSVGAKPGAEKEPPTRYIDAAALLSPRGGAAKWSPGRSIVGAAD